MPSCLGLVIVALQATHTHTHADFYSPPGGKVPAHPAAQINALDTFKGGCGAWTCSGVKPLLNSIPREGSCQYPTIITGARPAKGSAAQAKLKIDQRERKHYFVVVFPVLTALLLPYVKSHQLRSEQDI